MRSGLKQGPTVRSLDNILSVPLDAVPLVHPLITRPWTAWLPRGIPHCQTYQMLSLEESDSPNTLPGRWGNDSGPFVLLCVMATSSLHGAADPLAAPTSPKQIHLTPIATLFLRCLAPILWIPSRSTLDTGGPLYDILIIEYLPPVEPASRALSGLGPQCRSPTSTNMTWLSTYINTENRSN